MATLLSTIVTRVRQKLQEPVENFWSDAEILHELNGGIDDLWRAINAQYQDYSLTVDATNVSIAASTATVTGIPADCAIVRGVEPRVPASFPFLRFEFRPYNDKLCVAARAMVAQDLNQVGTLYLSLAGDAGPVGAPTIYVQPQLTSALPLRFSYVKSLPVKTASDANPIPGQADKALEFWAIAHCRAKSRDDQAPDPDWLALYATQKVNILAATAPRQEQDDQVSDGVFEDLW